MGRAAGLDQLNTELGSLDLDAIAASDALGSYDAARAAAIANRYATRWLELARDVAGQSAAERVLAGHAANESLDSRDRMIAATETAGGFNDGRSQAIAGAHEGLTLLKVWDAQLDACPICAAADGTIVGIHERFALGEPGSVHPWCRCVWTLLTMAEHGTDALIEPAPVQPVFAPAARPAAAPKPSPFRGEQVEGGRLAVTPETKAWAKKLDISLGSLGKDGGKAARESLREIVESHGFISRDFERGAPDALHVVDMPFAGLHHWDGKIEIAPKTLMRSRAGLRKLQLGFSPSKEEQDCIAALIHEELHGTSPLRGSAYQGVGAALEEATTERAAQTIARQLFGKYESSIYGDEIAGLREVLGTQATEAQISELLDAGILRLKRLDRMAETPDQHVANFVRGLKLTPAQRTRVQRELMTTEWWKPGFKPKALPKVTRTRPALTAEAKAAKLAQQRAIKEAERVRKAEERAQIAAEKKAAREAEKAAAKAKREAERAAAKAEREAAKAAAKAEREQARLAAREAKKREAEENKAIAKELRRLKIEINAPVPRLREHWRKTFAGAEFKPSDVREILGLPAEWNGKPLKVRSRVNVGLGGGGLSVDGSSAGISISRTFRPGRAHHDYFFLDKKLQGKGLGNAVLRGQANAYTRLGIKTVDLDAAEVGRYVWPTMGFEPDAAGLAKFKSEFALFLAKEGLRVPPLSKVTSLEQIARMQHKGRKIGKEFLLGPAHQMERLTQSLDSLIDHLK